MADFYVVQTTTSKQKDAQAIAKTLVEQRLAACVKVIGPIHSVYRWQGKVESAEEWICQAKTTFARRASLMTAVQRVHPYDEPEIIALPIADGSVSYLKWVDDQVSSET